MTFTLVINMDNAAFEDDLEVARIIRKYLEKVEFTGIPHEPIFLRDINGNQVGVASFQGRKNNGE